MSKRKEMFVPFDELVLGNDAEFDNDRQSSGLGKVEIRALAESIKEHGLLNRLHVWVPPEDEGFAGQYVIVSGERRYRAIQLLIENDEAGDLENSVPVVIVDGDRVNARLVAFVDNFSRSDLNGLETAQALRRLIDKGITQKEVATRVKKSQAWVSLHLGVLKKATEEVQEAWAAGKITDSDAFQLMQVDNPKKQNTKLEEVISLRESGKRKKASDAAKDAKRDNATSTTRRPSATERRVMLEDLKHAESVDPYIRGVIDALRFSEGEIAWNDFDKSMYPVLNPIIEARRTEELAVRAAKVRSINNGDGNSLFDDDDDDNEDDNSEHDDEEEDMQDALA